MLVLLWTVCACSLVPTATVPPPSATLAPTDTALPPIATLVPTATAPPPAATLAPTAMALSPTATATLAPTLSQAITDETTARQLRVFTHLWESVRDLYVYPDFNGLDWDDVQQRYRARIEAGVDDKAFYQAMREMIDELGDEHSVFNSPQEVAEEEKDLLGQLDYVGIGIYVTTLPDEDHAVLLQVFPGSPAEQAGMLPHDRILAVEGQPVIDEQGYDQLDLLIGSIGSEVRVTVQTPGQEPRELLTTRARIQAQLPVDARRLPGTDVGYILVPTFWDLTIADRVRQALEGLLEQGELAGLIVDMRINGGGVDVALTDTLALFTQGEQGAFVNHNDARSLFIQADPVGNSQELPLVVLVGRETQSFGEVFSGVLQESGRALLVGRTTTGNVETLWNVDLEDGSRAWIAAETFRPPSGADWEENGIVPDVEIPLDWDDFTSQQDPQLQAALDWLLNLIGTHKDTDGR
ncbi:MAG: S41 family peptidase [Anaerolineae bacterium]